jgi:uncharacterized protein YceK
MRPLVTALLLASLSGCATLNETFDDNARCGPRPYCGAATDVEYLQMLTDGKAGVLAAFIPLVVIDLPLSVIGDTLVLPYTAFNAGQSR